MTTPRITRGFFVTGPSVIPFDREGIVVYTEVRVVESGEKWG